MSRLEQAKASTTCRLAGARERQRLGKVSARKTAGPALMVAPGPRSARLALFDQPLERCDVVRHLVACLAADHERHQDLADAVPVKSMLIVSREREPVTGSTRTSTAARIGPSVPRTPQARGGSIWVSSEVDGRLAPPMRRVVTHFAPTAGVWAPSSGPSMCPSTTPFCHWLNRVGSVA
jgi:hypothetical protein